MKTMLKFFKWALWSLLSILTVAGLVFAVWLNLARHQVASDRAITSSNGIEVLEEIEIGGIKQWLSIRGHNKDNPVILYLHGGPGTPMMPFSHLFQTPWEEHFTVVQWDQRGAGKTYFANDPDEVVSTINYERMKSDALEVTNYLRHRLGKEKIILLGHSWGTMIGLPLAMERPDLFHAYVGTGQVISVYENEKVGYERTIAEAKRLNNEAAISELESIAPYPHPTEGTTDRRDILRKWQYELGLALTDNRNYYVQVLLAGLRSPDYSLRDLSYFFLQPKKHKAIKIPVMASEIDQFDVRKWGAHSEIPLFFFMGRNDWQTPSIVAKRYFDEVEAPEKEFVWFEESGHSPPTAEPEEFLRSLLEVVRPTAMKEGEDTNANAREMNRPKRAA